MPKAMKRSEVRTSAVLSQRDADKFARAAKTFAAKATTSKAAAKKALRSLGINPNTGELVELPD